MTFYRVLFYNASIMQIYLLSCSYMYICTMVSYLKSFIVCSNDIRQNACLLSQLLQRISEKCAILTLSIFSEILYIYTPVLHVHC